MITSQHFFHAQARERPSTRVFARTAGGVAMFPKSVRPKAPPIKTQGIKTKLTPMIAASIRWSGKGQWIEPFVGSGAVALNLAPQRALLADTNKHIVEFYSGVQSGLITGSSARRFLEFEGQRLLDAGESHYYYIRDRFNDHGDPLDFLFLSRACFNGVMRFNSKGRFNVPFCRKPERYRQALITKIANQIDWAAEVMAGKDWSFVVQPWQKTIESARPGDLIYCDPPYVGRHTDYYNGFTDEEADQMAQALLSSKANFALSMWLENKYRRNEYLDRWFANHPMETTSHFYHVGSSEELRNEMTEALVLSHTAVVTEKVALIPSESDLPLFQETETANI
ncbi:DNA adenine methylase [Cupriavidus campinensis]